MPSYTVITERQDIGGKENWHATIGVLGESGALIDRDGDTESEAITIAFVELLGNLPADFPRALIGDFDRKGVEDLRRQIMADIENARRESASARDIANRLLRAAGIDN